MFTHQKLCLAATTHRFNYVKITHICCETKHLQILFNPLTAKLVNLDFTHLKLCLADAIHNFKRVKIIQNWQNGGQLLSNLPGWCHILSLTYLNCGT